MNELAYEAPNSVEAAVSLLSKGGMDARIFAGGTDLLVQMRQEVLEPTLLIDIKNIDDARTIKISGNEVYIGAALTGAELGEHETLRRLLPGVVEAIELIGSAQVQGRATIGGNMCNASPAADSVPALIAGEAVAVIAGPNGSRDGMVSDLLHGPGQTGLERGEFVVAVKLPRPSARSADAYLRFIPRTEMDIAVVGAGVALTLNADGTCAKVRLALGAVAPTARLVHEAADILVGCRLEKTVLEQLADVARNACDPIDDKRGTIEFRMKVAGVLACRATRIAWERAEKNV
jgi:carbon-monoxide dehydrogenase medium subunit